MSEKNGKSKRARMRQTMASLHREMEIAPKKRVTRGESLQRTKKRKKLEKDEQHEFELRIDENQQTRLRGSQAAYQDEVVRGSLIFPNPNQVQPQEASQLSPQQQDGEDKLENFEPSDSEVDVGEFDEDDDDGEDDDDEAGADVEEGEEDDEDIESALEPNASTEIEGRFQKKKRTRRRRYRLKNFQSVRMAQRHGDALKFHASGQPKLAIEALQNVARDAPSAPQVYSSLGMVYEDMLKESFKRSMLPGEQRSPDAAETDENLSDAAILNEQLDFAKKAYGSYHVAAILCKQDFSLWVKAADCAIDAAEIHGRAMTMLDIPMEQRLYHKSEKKRWYSEALGDLKVADNLKPPGIEVPAKLASAHMELGKLSEALTILTDLKNRQTTDGFTNEFQSSYKAWLLYADLMLRIGHECMQWNRGVQNNDNYMFRRWLRKLSRTFDWQERRLQSLALAFEAAAGTRSTEKFKSWMLQRAMTTHTGDRDSRSESERWHIGLDNSEKEPSQEDIRGIPDESGASLPSSNKQKAASREAALALFEQERSLLLEKNSAELEAFDKTTVEMKLAEGTAAAKNDRELSRNSMLRSHEEAVTALDNECRQDGGDIKKIDDIGKIDTGFGGDLPISASCRQVVAIASELTKHLHGLELYDGARLVGESVSACFKQRASRYDKRALSRQRHDEYQEKLAKSPFLLLSYEDMYGKDSDDDDETSPYLSDDDELDNNNNFSLLDSLRNGALPPELRVLFGLALIGEGGRNYVAAKCIEKIDDLQQESLTWLRDGELETTLAGDPLWSLFHRAMTEPLGRTAAYSFLADVLRKTNKEAQWSNFFAPWFRRHLKTLKAKGLLDEVLALKGKISPFVNFRKNQVLKIIMAANKFDVDLIATPETSTVAPILPNLAATSQSDSLELALSAMKSIGDVLHLMWKVEDGNLSSMCTEAIAVCSKCTNWLSKLSHSHLSYSKLHDVLEMSRIILSPLCSHPIRDLKDTSNLEALMEKEWGVFPVDSSWQSSECRALSLAVYNLAVGCNVSLFSGWEKEEFTLKLLRRRHGNKHFGVHIHDRRITGFLSDAQESQISRQWNELKTLFPEFPELNFDARIAEVKQREWYQKEIEDRKQTVGSSKIARFAEDQGVSLFLSFSSFCLQLLQTENNAKTRNRLLQLCLSVLLPISQFCVDDMLWQSDIGEGAASVEGFDEWRLFTDLAPDVGGPNTSKSRSLYHKRRKEEKAIEKKVEEWIKGSDKPVIRTYVKLPLSVLLEVWNASTSKDTPTSDALDYSRQAMEAVHAATVQLRSCYSEMATEKASVNLAVALLELASHPTCFDPFSCLQHAAMFASQGSKSGSSDEAFRHPLPDAKECAPMEALTILGRADCLQSLYFPNEAAFLCSYVARVCRMHRDRNQPEYEWTDQWRILAIMAFNVSVLIRTTVSTVLDQEMQKSFLSIWERDVVEELEKARRDGWTWKRKYVQKNQEGGTNTEPLVGEEEENGESDRNDEMEEEEDENGEDGSDGESGEDTKDPGVAFVPGASFGDGTMASNFVEDKVLELGNLMVSEPGSHQTQGGDSGDDSTTNIVMVSV